ncbi:unnamed protein product [Parascedosporium putredinis]|uniref:Uncharacterized protein n=1 Tax=Parascedosporium putredinis TaxID=1442378 RepID=A0A9P1H5J8_9PEZI|nr:unnamed protein product [Parascedosporium putredinis]CAI7996435.1 unnamed protein product [Parascedosporium putredinis]
MPHEPQVHPAGDLPSDPSKAGAHSAFDMLPYPSKVPTPPKAYAPHTIISANPVPGVHRAAVKAEASSTKSLREPAKA